MIKDGCQCFTCRHRDEPRVVAGYLQGYIDACDWFLNWAKKNNIKQGSISDDDLGGIVAQMDCNRVESSCLMTCFPDLEIEEVKSQDECKKEIKSKSGRDVEVLITAIDELEKTKKQLEIAIEALGLIDKRKCHMANCMQNCPLRKYYEKNKGCATCLNKACHTALQQIKELEK